ncbi:threonine ammonia-lyase [Streptomyces mirabilis]|uniref:threonine ammonia-lyase n=1 Tax=Streptomyces mirabilis TaxID=68239 RepID=UPI00225C277B|nr:threonine/serine dehydratase [Streptomyces mirabilis]MCX4430412.1 threonine/serine dehydratase [Streptomyces mirabilis]
MTLVTFNDIYAASQRLEHVVSQTSLLKAPWASCTHRSLLLKPENLQITGSFKIRGAYNRLSRLSEAEKARGVIARSSGNHGKALAYVARQEGVKVTIVMPVTAAKAKVDGVLEYGAEVKFAPLDECAKVTEELAEKHGFVVVPPFDDPDVIAGQGTVGLEIAEEAVARGLDVDTVLVPVSGGGLISGVAAALKLTRPGVRVVGVEPELAADAQESLRAGRRVTWPAQRVSRTLADGLRMSTVGVHPFEHMQVLVDDIITVTEEEICSSVAILARRAGMIVEPSGAVTTAAYLYHERDLPAGAAHVAVVSGGNIDADLLESLLNEPPLAYTGCCSY